MGIKEGTQIKKYIRGAHKGVIEEEAAKGGQSEVYRLAKYWIVDCMLDVYTKPPYVKTGRQLSWWFYNKFVAALMADKTVVLIFDDSRRVPQNKAACQAKRRSNPPVVPDDLCITDDDELYEPWYDLVNTGKYRLMIFEYLLMNLDARVKGMTTNHDGCLFVSRPWASRSFYDTTWLSGGPVEITSTGRAMPPGPHVHGEGDMLCRVWSDHFAATDPDATIVIRSKDLDMLGIYSITPPKGDCHLHVTTSKAQPQKYEFIRVRHMHRHLFKNRERAMSFVYSLILAGSDYCEGITGIGGLRLVRQALEQPDKDNVMQFTDKRPHVAKKRMQLDKKRLMAYLGRASSKKAPPSLEANRLSLCRASWNMDYWLFNNKVPDPIAYGGWERTANGYMPITH